MGSHADRAAADGSRSWTDHAPDRRLLAGALALLCLPVLALSAVFVGGIEAGHLTAPQYLFLVHHPTMHTVAFAAGALGVGAFVDRAPRTDGGQRSLRAVAVRSLGDLAVPLESTVLAVALATGISVVVPIGTGTLGFQPALLAYGAATAAVIGAYAVLWTTVGAALSAGSPSLRAAGVRFAAVYVGSMVLFTTVVPFGERLPGPLSEAVATSSPQLAFGVSLTNLLVESLDPVTVPLAAIWGAVWFLAALGFVLWSLRCGDAATA